MKVIKFFLGLVIFLLLFLVISAVILLALVTDYNVKQPDYLNDDNLEITTGENLISKSLDTVGTDKNICFSLSEMEVNLLLKSLLVETNESLKDTPVQIDTAFVTLIDEKNISFKSYFSVYGIKASLNGNFSYTLGYSSLIFRIDEITLSKITMNYDLLNSFNVNKKEIENIINSKVESLGLKVYFEEEVLTIYVNEEMYKKLFSKNFESIKNPVITNILFNDVDFKLDNNMIGLNKNINNYTIDPTNDFMINLEPDFIYYCGRLNDLLVNNIIELSSVNIVGNYLIKGYSCLNDDDKSFIKNLDLSSIGIIDNVSYSGAKEYTDSNLTEVLVSQIPNMTNSLYITELEINQNLMANDFVGSINFFARKENDKYILNYIAIDSVYLDVRNREMDLYFIVNINGARVSVKMMTFLKESENFRLSFEINKIKMGNVEIEEDIKREIITYLSTELENKWLKVMSNETIVFDFSSLIVDNDKLNEINNLSSKTYILLSGDKNSGQLEFVFE